MFEKGSFWQLKVLAEHAYRSGSSDGKMGRCRVKDLGSRGARLVRHQHLACYPSSRRWVIRPDTDEIDRIALSKSLAQIVLCEVHAVEKSMFPVKPDGLEMVWPDGPPYQSASLVEDLSNHSHPSLHILHWSCGGREGRQGLAGAVRGNAFARPRRTYRSATTDY